MGLSFNHDSFNETMTTTQTTATDGVQAVAPQKMTEPVDTSLFTTPTMTFGEVGKTTEQETTGYESNAHGVGHFEANKLLERNVLVNTYNWTVSLGGSPLFSLDIDKFLRQYTRNWEILRQFRYYRSDIEVTVRLNTNQFYFGVLMVNMWPGNETGNWEDELAVLDPTIISASCAEAVVKTWKYSYPYAWKSSNYTDSGTPVNLNGQIVASLATASPDMPDSITVSVWARFKNIQLAYPCLQDGPPFRIKAQSAKGGLQVRWPKKRGGGTHPSTDSGAHAGPNPLTTLMDAVGSMSISDAVDGVGQVADFVSDNWGGVTGLLGLLDKPDRVDPQCPMIVEAASDMYSADVPDTNVSIGLYKDRYVDPGMSRMPMTKSWTISDYARIPGLRGTLQFFGNSTTPATLDLIRRVGTDSNRIPLDYAFLNAFQWRGSIKVHLAFYTSAFTSARFVVQYINQTEFPDSWETNYADGLSRVIDVKGDTNETITLPWMSRLWWSTNPDPRIRITRVSEMATTDPSVDAKIYCLVWVAGGEDIQFAFPRIPLQTEWPYREVALRKEAQSCPGEVFKSTFPPIAENTFYDVDRGYCTGEIIGPITDVAKRYSPLPKASGFDDGFIDSEMLDQYYLAPVSGSAYAIWEAFRHTFYGSWRACFLYRSGGYRWRQYPNRNVNWRVTSNSDWEGVTYTPPFDGTDRITVPQLMQIPFGALGNPNHGLSIISVPTVTDSTTNYIAARDDVQFGYPILPTGIPLPYVPPDDMRREKRKGDSSLNVSSRVVK